MKRIIYSIYTDNIDPHKSTNDFKKAQFEKWKFHIEKNHKNYAFLCGADYYLHTTNTTSYDEIQFEKIILLEEYAKDYDEMLYLDFDVVSHTDINYFNYHDMTTLTAHGLDRTPTAHKFKYSLDNNNFHLMNMYSKTCAKNAMLLLEDKIGNNYCLNTGVVGCNKDIAFQLNFKNRLSQLHSLLDEAIIDNVYPKEISSVFFYNNEVYLSYIIERYNIPYTNIGMPWNFMLDDYFEIPSAGAHLVHHVNKKFEISFNGTTFKSSND